MPIRFQIFVFAAWSLGVSSVGLADSNSFEDRLQYIREQRTQEVGRDVQIEAYEQLIRDFPGDPRCAEAMYDVGKLWNSILPELNLGSDRVQAIEWYRRAASTALPGSDLWTEMKFRIASSERRNISKQRKILDEIVNHADGDSLVLAKVEHDLAMACLRDGDIACAEEHCFRLLNWLDAPNRVPDDGRKRSKILGLQRSAARVTVRHLASAKLSESERIRKINDMRKNYSWVGGIHDAARKALADIEYSRNLTSAPTMRPVESSTSVRRKRFHVAPASVDFGNVEHTTSPSRMITVFTSGTHQRLFLERLKCPSPYVSAKMLKSEPEIHSGRTRHELEVRLDNNAPQGRFAAQLFIPCDENSGIGPTFWVRANISGPVRMIPKTVFLGFLDSNATAVRRTILKPVFESDSKVKIDSVDAVKFGDQPDGITLHFDGDTEPSIVVRVEATKLGIGTFDYTIPVTCRLGAKPCELKLKVTGMITE